MEDVASSLEVMLWKTTLAHTLVFAELGSSASQVKDAPKLLKLPKSECPDLWIRLPRHKWPKSMAQHSRTSGFFERGMCADTPSLDCCARDSSKKFL